MNVLKKMVSLTISVLMLASMFVSTNVFATSNFTNPSLYFSEDFEDDTVGTTATNVTNKLLTNSKIAQDPVSGNKYLLASDIVYLGSTGTEFDTWISDRGCENWIFSFDLLLPTEDTRARFYHRRASTDVNWETIAINESRDANDAYITNNMKVAVEDPRTSPKTIKDTGLTVEAGEWFHVAYMNNGNGFDLYINGKLALDGTSESLPNAIYLAGTTRNFYVDNLKIYGFSNADVTSAVEKADEYRITGGRATTARLDAAQTALINAENSAVQNSASATATYANEINKINTIIEQYNMASEYYEEYKNDSKLSNDVTELLSAVDDIEKNDDEIVALFDAIDEKITGPTFANPSLYFGEDFEDDTVGATATNIANRFTTNSKIAQDPVSGNKYLLASDIVYLGSTGTEFATWLSERNCANWVFSFDVCLPNETTRARIYPRRGNTDVDWEAIGFNEYKADNGSYSTNNMKVTVNNNDTGLAAKAGEWMHVTYINNGNGFDLYINDVLALDGTSAALPNTIYLAGTTRNFYVDNLKIYGFSNADVASAVAKADDYRTTGNRTSTARLDAAQTALIIAENTAVQNSATATANYTNDVAKVNTIIEQYKKASVYEAYKSDATLGAEVTALLNAVDDTSKTDAEIASLFAALDPKLEVVVFIDEVEQYIADNSSIKNTDNLSYVLEKYNTDKSDVAMNHLKKVYALYKTPDAKLINSKTFTYDFSDADLLSSGMASFTKTSLDTVNKNYVMSVEDAGLAYYVDKISGVNAGTPIDTGVISTSATLNFTTNNEEHIKALMICGTDRDIPVIGLAARSDGYFYLNLNAKWTEGIRLCTYQANTPYEVKLVADLDKKIGEIYINGVKQATDGPVLLQSSTVSFVMSSRAGKAPYTVDNIVMAADVMKNKINFSDKDEVTSDLILPVSTTDGYPIKWSTNNASVVDANGKVNVPSNGSATAVLTANVLCGEETASYSYVVNVGNKRTLYRSHNFSTGDNVVKMTVNLANVTTSSKDARSYLVVINKDTKEIVSIDAAELTATVEAGKSGSLTNTVSVPDDGKNYLVRGFVWDSQLVPLANIDAIPVNEIK